MVNELKPDYKFIIDGRRVNKQRFTKKKLTKLGKDSSLTGSEIIKEMGISKIYSVGQLKFELNFICSFKENTEVFRFCDEFVYKKN